MDGSLLRSSDARVLADLADTPSDRMALLTLELRTRLTFSRRMKTDGPSRLNGRFHELVNGLKEIPDVAVMGRDLALQFFQFLSQLPMI